MKNKNLITAATVGLLLGGGLGGGYYRADAAIPVIDTTNIAQTHANVIQAIQTAANTLTQIENQLLELKTMDPARLIAQKLGIGQQFDQIKSTISEAKGIMSDVKSVETAWNSTFGDIENLLNGGLSNAGANAKQVAYSLDHTYKDALRVAKDIGKVDDDVKHLNDLMDDNGSATGNKQAQQTQNALLAQQNTLLIKQNQGISALTSTVVANAAKQNQIDAQTTADNQKIIDAADQHSAKGNPAINIERGKL
jgi:P-type conjugative transfer protein TrbJ